MKRYFMSYFLFTNLKNYAEKIKPFWDHTHTDNAGNYFGNNTRVLNDIVL
jgi:hypothetical protein